MWCEKWLWCSVPFAWLKATVIALVIFRRGIRFFSLVFGQIFDQNVFCYIFVWFRVFMKFFFLILMVFMDSKDFSNPKKKRPKNLFKFNFFLHVRKKCDTEKFPVERLNGWTRPKIKNLHFNEVMKIVRNLYHFSLKG